MPDEGMWRDTLHYITRRQGSVMAGMLMWRRRSRAIIPHSLPLGPSGDPAPLRRPSIPIHHQSPAPGSKLPRQTLAPLTTRTFPIGVSMVPCRPARVG